MDEFEQFESYDAGAAEARMKAGGQIPPGRYPAQLLGAKRTESKAKQTPGWELTFLVTDGPFKGTEVTDTLYVTENTRSKDRLVLFGHRLGLLEKKPDGSGYVRAKDKTDLTDCLDAKVVIEVIHEPDQKDPNKKWTRLAFQGVFLPNDPELKKPAKSSGPTLPGTTAATASAAKPAEAEAGGRKKVQRGDL